MTCINEHKIYFLLFWFHAASIYTRSTHGFITFQCMLFPILINTCPAASVLLTESYTKRSVLLFVQINISPFYLCWGHLGYATLGHGITNDDGSIMGPVKNGGMTDLRWLCGTSLLLHFNHNFLFFFKRVRGIPGGPAMPGKVTFLCTSHQKHRKRKLDYIIHQAAQFSCHS